MGMPTYRASGAIANLQNAGSVALPAGLEVNDILHLVIETANQTVTITDDGGGTWTEITNSPQGTGTAGTTTATRLTVFESRYNGTQTAPSISDSGDHQIARIHAYVGVRTTGNGWNITSGNVEAASDTSLSATGATTTAPNCLVCIYASLMDDAQNFGATWTNASLSNITVRQNSSGTAGNDGRHILVTGEKATAGTYNATTNTLSANSVKAMMTVALEGAADVFTGSGALAASASLAASAAIAFVGAAALAVTQPGISGTGSLIEARTATAAMAVSQPAIASTGALTFTASGALSVPGPAVEGTGTHSETFLGSGGIAVTTPSIEGTGTTTGLVLSGTAALAVTAPTLDATGVLSFAATGALGTSTTISGSGALTFAGSAAISVPSPVFVGGEQEAPQGVIASDHRTIAIDPVNSGTVARVWRHGSSVMDTYTCDNDGGTADSDHHTADDAPMKYWHS